MATKTRSQLNREADPANREVVAFRVELVGDNVFLPILVDASGFDTLRLSACACVRQARHSATRGGTKDRTDLGLFQRRDGAPVQISEDPECTVSPTSWVWQHHHFTH